MRGLNAGLCAPTGLVSRAGCRMVYFIRLFEMAVATAFYSGLCYMIFDGAGTAAAPLLCSTSYPVKSPDAGHQHAHTCKMHWARGAPSGAWKRTGCS